MTKNVISKEAFGQSLYIFNVLFKLSSMHPVPCYLGAWKSLANACISDYYDNLFGILHHGENFKIKNSLQFLSFRF